MYMQSHSHCFNACLKGRFFNIMESKEYLKRSDTDDDARIDWGIIFCVLVLAVIGMTAAVPGRTPSVNITIAAVR